MSTTKIGWLSDTHIDFYQYGLKARWQDFNTAFENAVDDMIQHGVHGILHTGDILHSSKPSSAAMKFLQRLNDKLLDAGITMWVVEGNHEAAKPHWLEIANDPTNTHGMHLLDGAAEIDGIKLFGISQSSPDEFRRKVKEMPEGTDILACHQSITEFIHFEAPGALKAKDLPLDKCQVVAIGDIHINSMLQAQSNCIYGYTGSTEMNSETEDTEKVWRTLKFTDGRLTSTAEHPIKTRPVLKLNIKTDEELKTALVQAANFYRTAGAEPMFFIKYKTNVPDVTMRFRQTFDPEKCIMRFNPVYVPAKTQSTDSKIDQEVGENNLPVMTLEDVLQVQLQTCEQLSEVAHRLVDPNADANDALDTYIERRLAVA